MEQYQMIKEKDLGKISKEELLRKYNDVVEATWLYCHKLHELTQNYDALMYDYEKVTAELYG